MAATQAPNLGVWNGWVSGESGWTNQMNENLLKLDFFAQATVLDRDLTAPPGSPTDGAAYIVAASPTGAWSGQAGKIAIYRSSLTAWEFYTPKNGWIVGVVDENAAVIYTSTGWVVFGGGGGGTMAAQNANAVNISGGDINGTTIGATTRAAGNFTNVGVGVAHDPTYSIKSASPVLVDAPTGQASFYVAQAGTINGRLAGVGGVKCLVEAIGTLELTAGADITFNLGTAPGATSAILKSNGNFGIGYAVNPTSHKLEVAGRVSAGGGFVFPPFTVATVPSASANTNVGIIVTNAASGRRPYWSNGTDWRDAANVILS